MARRALESLVGIGEIYAGDVLLRRTRYDLSLWTDDLPSSAAGSGAATVHAEGHVDITGIGEALVLAGPDQLTLRLEDGQRLRFRLTGSGGGIVGQIVDQG
jgi:hypothetical protein